MTIPLENSEPTDRRPGPGPTGRAGRADEVRGAEVATLAGVGVGWYPWLELVRAIQVILDGLRALPACVLNARFDILAFNRAYGELISDLAAPRVGPLRLDVVHACRAS